MRRFAQGITERRQKWKEEKEREEREEKERKEKEKNIDYDKVYKLYLKAVSLLFLAQRSIPRPFILQAWRIFIP